jgi:hypothetical protein
MRCQVARPVRRAGRGNGSGVIPTPRPGPTPTCSDYGARRFGTLVERKTRFKMLLHLPPMDGHGATPRSVPPKKTAEQSTHRSRSKWPRGPRQASSTAGQRGSKSVSDGSAVYAVQTAGNGGSVLVICVPLNWAATWALSVCH